jgi:hypothetical protein
MQWGICICVDDAPEELSVDGWMEEFTEEEEDGLESYIGMLKMEDE